MGVHAQDQIERRRGLLSVGGSESHLPCRWHIFDPPQLPVVECVEILLGETGVDDGDQGCVIERGDFVRHSTSHLKVRERKRRGVRTRPGLKAGLHFGDDGGEATWFAPMTGSGRRVSDRNVEPSGDLRPLGGERRALGRREPRRCTSELVGCAGGEHCHEHHHAESQPRRQPTHGSGSLRRSTMTDAPSGASVRTIRAPIDVNQADGV